MGVGGSSFDSGMVDGDGVVRIGSVVFALIRPTPGHELAFNHWYERDHYYTTGTAAPGVFSAARFVQPKTGWHLALYLVLPGFDAARVAFATEQTTVAAAEDRLFTAREHLHTWTYEVEAATVGVDGVPPALALDHRYPAITAALFDEEPSSRGGPSLTLRPVQAVMPSEWEGEIDVTRRRTVVEFHDDPADSVRPGSVWSGAFVPVVFGTDTHITQTP